MRAFRHRSLLFLTALASCWTLWVAVNSIIWAAKAPEKLPYNIRYNGVDGALGLALCALLFVGYDRIRRRSSPRRLLLVVVPLCVGAALIWHVTSAVSMWALGWNDRLYLEPKMVLLGGGLGDGMTLVLFSLLYFAVDHWLEAREQQQQARDALALATQAQLQMLRYQLNPHFLFNALNSIRAMIVREPERARQIVTELSEFLRYSLSGCGHEATIGEELQAIENYLAIQRIRFEEKLVVTVHADPALMDFVVPCFLIHPLVENAVKHGMETSEPPLRIELRVTAAGETVIIGVANTGRLVPAEATAADGGCNGTGTGLKNVRQRLALAFAGRHVFSLTEREGWVRAEIRLARGSEVHA
jgi:hypothetical protein